MRVPPRKDDHDAWPMDPGEKHPWSVTPGQAPEIQRRLAGRVDRQWSGSPVRLVAGADCAYSEDDALCAAAVVVWDLEARAEVDAKSVTTEIRFPYIPGLFAFREAPAVLEAFERLETRPQLLICHGHGIAHPRRFGLASHIGVLAGIPTIGCAKRRLCGNFTDPEVYRGSRAPLVDRGETIGTALRTRTGVKPVFVSIGHRIDLPTAEQIILSCAIRYRLPEPLRLAHRCAAALLKRIKQES
jgi:deoxyribonuclease V